MEAKDRIKYFRKSVKGLTQAEFSRQINMSQSNLASIETGVIKVTDRTISIICDKFNLSSEWLRTGNGDMYRESESSIVQAVADQYNLTPAQRCLMEMFLAMDEEKREALATSFFDLVETANQDLARLQQLQGMDPIDVEVESYRKELEAEKRAASLSGTGDDVIENNA